jgi:hypothetical protein
MMNNCMKMISPLSYQSIENLENDVGCAYVLEEPDGWHSCGAVCKLSSPYCPHHHALCHIACGTKAETDHLREVEALASAVGGRRARQRAEPTRHFLKRLEQVVRGGF